MQPNPTIMSPSLTVRDNINRGSARLFGKDEALICLVQSAVARSLGLSQGRG